MIVSHAGPEPHGKRRGPPENGLAGGDPAGDFEASSAVTTRSPSFNPSMTSVTTPSLIPVLICTGWGRPPEKTYTVRSLVRRSRPAPPRALAGAGDLAIVCPDVTSAGR